MAKTAELERMLEENDFPGVVIEESDGRLVVSGIVMTEDERRSVLELLQDATEEPLEDDLEVEGTMPAVIRELADPARVDRLSDVEVSEAEMRGFHGATEGLEEDTLEPGDFQSPDHVETDGWTAVGPTSALDEDLVAEGDTVFVPPSDPVVRRDPVTFRERVVGGLQESSMDDLHVPRSALDGQYGDEAIADAVRRELREDAATADLEDIHVSVRDGVVRLRGRVPFLMDADNAEEVAGRVPGVKEVIEELTAEAEEGS